MKRAGKLSLPKLHMPKMQLPQAHWPRLRRLGGRIGAIALLVVVWLVLVLYIALFILAKGPSPTASNLFVCSVQETSAVGFLARLFFSQEQIDRITGANVQAEYQEMDTSLIVMPPQEAADREQEKKADAWGLVDEDGDGIILETVNGESYTGYMMVVLDPSRVILGSVPGSYGGRGYTVAEMAKRFDAVAAINAGGFDDPGGKGNGSVPETMVAFKGKIYESYLGCGGGFAGFDDKHILHVGKFSAADLRERNIQYGCGFGPVLIVNGEAVDPSLLRSGLNPRTAIGQRADGAVLLLVIDGRQVTSLGASYHDLVDILLSYGAVNACNMDGGSSSLMWHNGDYVNTCASVLGIRPVPTSFLVLKEGQHE